MTNGTMFVITGDSITDAHGYGIYMAGYYHLMYPSNQLYIVLQGRGGSTYPELISWPTNGASNRFDRRVVGLSPSIVSGMMGMNGAYTKGQYIDQLVAFGVTNVGGLGATPVLFGPHPQDDADMRTINGDFSDACVEVAGTNGWASVRTWQSLTNVWATYDIDGADETHPAEGGHLLIALALLRGLGEETNVSSATIDASSLAVVASNYCTISNVQAISRGISFQRRDWRLPMGRMDGSTAAFAWDGTAREFQSYTIKLTNHTAGRYVLTIDGTTVAYPTSSELAAGYNMAKLTNGPIHEQGQEVLRLLHVMHDKETNWPHADKTPRIGVGAYDSQADVGYNTLGLRGENLRLYLQVTNSDYIDIKAAATNVKSAALPVMRTFQLYRGGFETITSTARVGQIRAP